MKQRITTSLVMLAVAALLPVIWIARLVAQDDEGYFDDQGNWVHDTGLGFEVIEAVNGFTANGPAQIALGDSSITLPQTTGLYWGSGDTPYGYGIVVGLPKGTQIFFSLVEKVALVDPPSGQATAADADLLRQILATAPGYRVVATRGELPADSHAVQESQP